MKLIKENPMKFLSVKASAYGALFLGVIPILLQHGMDLQLIPAQYHAVILTIVLPLLAMAGKKVYQPELHIATNQSQIKAFASVLPSVKPKFFLGSRSITRLKGVHPDLVKVVKRAIQITECDFTVIEGVRTKARQAELVKTGASQTFNSRHLTGHAIDLAAWVNGTVSWDWKYYYQIEKAMKQAAQELNVSIEWGGDWRKFKDGPHWQLPWSKYPS